ncbi:MAG: PEP-CTERM sorting domain-containing protein [Pirellulaceae bacterium]
MKKTLLLACALMLLPLQADAQNFSVSPAQLDIFLAPPPPDDILGPGFPPFPVMPGGTGLNVDAISYNQPFPFESITAIDFSVDSAAVGLAGTAVFAEAGIADAQSDIFRSFVSGTNFLQHDGDGSVATPGVPLGLTEGAANLAVRGVDGFESQPTGPPPMLPTGGPGIIYWSVDGAAIGAPLSPYAAFSAADIFIDLGGGYAGAPVLYAGSGMLGLAPTDEVDGLVVFDGGAPGVFDGPDLMLFSLGPASPSLGGLGVTPGDVLLAGGGGAGFLGVFAPAASLGLVGGVVTPDNLNALSVVPEPASLGLVIGLAGCCLIRRKRTA